MSTRNHDRAEAIRDGVGPARCRATQASRVGGEEVTWTLHCRLVLHAGFVKEVALPVKLTDDAGADKTWEQIRDECALLALHQNANLPTLHQDRTRCPRG